MYLDASHSYGGNWGIPNSTWAITHDNGKLYISADGHDSQPAWVARLSADTMNFEQFIWTSVVASEQGHRMVVVGDYLWSAIRPGKFLRVLKSDLNNFSEISTGMETAGEWTRAGVYAGGGYVWTCNSGSPSLLAQIEPNTLEVRTYNFPIGQGLCQSIQGDSQNLYFAFYQSPGKVSAVSLSSLINTTDSVPPTTPTNLTATTTTSSQINLSWTASTDNVGVTGYKVYRKTGTNPFTQIASTTITNYQDTTLTAETTYSYTVSAYDLAGNNSPQSLAVSASTLVPPPPPVISIGSRIQLQTE
jgi:hypothetical protein